MKKHLFSIIVLLLLPIPLWGATISVCSSGCSYTSIQSAYNAANTGDIVEIRDSRTYLEAVNMNKSGTSSSPITLRAASGFTPAVSSSGVWVDGAVVISGHWNVLSGVVIGPVRSGNGVYITGTHNIVQNCTLKDIDTLEMIAGTSGEGINIAGGQYNVVRNNSIGDCAHSCITLMRGSQSASYNQILNNKIQCNYGHGVSILFASTQYNLIEGNDISRIGTYSQSSGKNGIQISGGSNNSIRKNIFHSLYNRGIEIGAYSADSSPINNNYIYNNTFYNIPTRSDITGNNAWVKIGTASSGPYTVRDNKFINNIVAKVGMQQTSEWSAGLHGVWLYGHTTEYDAGDTESAVTATNDWNGNILKNNCIRVFFSNAYQLNYDSAIYYANAGGGVVLRYSVTGVNGKGSMSGNTTSDPLFASLDDAQSNWWYLQSGSPMIDGGIVVNDPNAATGGWKQLTYSGSRPDIGAFEASGTASTSISAPRNLRIMQ
jgi:hypothetical protein